MKSSVTLHYIEAFSHTELILNWMPLIAACKVDIVCHVSSSNARLLSPLFDDLNNLSFCSPPKAQEWSTYVDNLVFDTGSFVVIATTSRRYGWFVSLTDRVPYYVVIHSLNDFFDLPQGGNTMSLRGLVNSFKRTFGRSKHFLRAGASGFLYPSPDMRDGGERAMPNDGKSHTVLPFGYVYRPFRQSRYNRSGLPLKMVVPGTVTNRTRDYSILIPAIEWLSNQSIPFEIHLAGRLASSSIAEKLSDIVVTYEQGLSIEEYTTLLTSAHLLIAPLRQEIKVGGVIEISGKTKILGTVGDALLYNRPLLIPEWYPVPEGPVLQYHDEKSFLQRIQAIALEEVTFTEGWRSPTRDQVGQRWSTLVEKHRG